MENCKADNIAEKRFRSYWKKSKLSLCKKHLYQGLYINSCSVDVSAIKNVLLKHLQIYSKPRNSPLVSFSRIFSIRNTYFQEHLRVFSVLFFLAAICHTLFVSICFFKKLDGLYFFLQADYF